MNYTKREIFNGVVYFLGVTALWFILICAAGQLFFRVKGM